MKLLTYQRDRDVVLGALVDDRVVALRDAPVMRGSAHCRLVLTSLFSSTLSGLTDIR